MTSILFVYPNFNDPYTPNIGLTILLTYINSRSSHKAELLDLTLYKKRWKELIQTTLKRNKYDLVGFTSTIPTLAVSLEIARYIKSFDTRIKTIFGGVYASILKGKMFEFEEIDFICVGEGELAVIELLNNFDRNTDNYKIPGIWYRKGKEIINMGCSNILYNLDELPFNDFDYWNPKIMFPLLDHLPIIASRGCQYNCTFCTQSAMHELYDKPTNNRYYRQRSPQNVCDEIEYQLQKYSKIKKFKGVLFHDDTFTSNRNWLIEFCNLFRNRGLAKRVHWASNARIDNLDEKLLLLMKNSGCYYLYFGVETTSKKVQEAYRKRFDLNRVIELTKYMRKIGIGFRVYYMLEGPLETVEDNLNSLKMIRKLKPYSFQIMPFVPLPETKGSEIYKKTNPSQFYYIQNVFQIKKEKRDKKYIKYGSFAESLISVAIGHMMGSYLSILKHILIGFVSSDKKNRLYSKVIKDTVFIHFFTGLRVGKLKFIRDLLVYIKFYFQNGFGISDLFTFTLKKYILDNSFVGGSF